MLNTLVVLRISEYAYLLDYLIKKKTLMKGQVMMRKRKISLHLKEVPQVHEVAGEHELLRLGDEAVGHEAEVLHQFGRAVHRYVDVQLGPAQQTQQEVIDLRGKRGRQK